MHRDIKPANILINEEGFVKLSDFGISKDFEYSEEMASSCIGTFRYMSPERLRGEDYDISSDLWSLGIMIIQLFNKHYPFEDCAINPLELHEELVAENFMRNLRKFLQSMSKPMQHFVRCMVGVDKDSRSTIDNLLQHQWLALNGVRDLISSRYVVGNWLLEVEEARQGIRPHHDSRASAPFDYGSSPGASHRDRGNSKHEEKDDYYEDEEFEEYESPRGQGPSNAFFGRK